MSDKNDKPANTDNQVIIDSLNAKLTDLITLQKRLENERAVLQTMFDSIPDHIFCKDMDFNYTHFNKSLLEHHRINANDIIGKDDELGLGVPKSIADEYRATDRMVITENKAFTYEENVPANDGSIRLFETNKVPLVLNGVPMGIMGIARDITERKAMEEATQSANRSKTLFLANMSHEVRTPINSIIGFSELALNDELPAKTKEYLADIQGSAKWLLSIINNVLDISKIDAGKMTIEQIPFDLQEVLMQCRSEAIQSAEDKSIKMNFDFDTLSSAEKKLPGDPVRLRQIIMNLLSNAIKFTNSGSVEFSVLKKESPDEKITLLFQVKDSGIGMTPEQIGRVFEPFSQADESFTREFDGTGLGLSIAKSLIGLMGGVLDVDSTPGIGSTFSFELSFDKISDETGPSEEKITFSDNEIPEFNGEILVCEDNGFNKRVICGHLSKVGVKYIVANNGKEGVDVVTARIKSGAKPFDMILMDIQMPVMDGLEASLKINELGVKTPIIALSANIMTVDLENYKSHGMAAAVGKPFTAQELWNCLAMFLPVVGCTVIKKNIHTNEEARDQKPLKKYFVQSNRDTYKNIVQALDAGDFKLAHRIAHSLKGTAGQLREKNLQTAAAIVEEILSGENEQPGEEQMLTLKKELDSVLDKLAPFLLEERNVTKEKPVDKDRLLEVFDKLEPMLKRKDVDSLKLIGDLCNYPGTEELIKHIKSYMFQQALETLIGIRERLVSENEY